MDAIATSPAGALDAPADSMTGSTVPLLPEPGAEAGPVRSEAVWVLPHHPASAGDARRITRAALDAWGVDEDTTDQALLVVSELVTNAVEHACPPIALHLDRPTPGDALHIEVDDGGPATRDGAWTASCAPDEHGRGNDIVARLATAHGRRPGDHGITYWADL
ncbi:ATP-binding protein [Kitasatospora herbaricolor]|uniref:ATP-binding protein n=1 Tax=Kitasatospora herbaricolor TaxID=68217 RepID=UPI0036DD5576